MGQPGETATFKRPDGVEVAVTIPPGLKTGDFFEVMPPALMVRVPDGVGPGDFVVFRNTMRSGPNGTEVTEWCRTRVPDGATQEKYFACRLPVPSNPNKQQL